MSKQSTAATAQWDEEEFVSTRRQNPRSNRRLCRRHRRTQAGIEVLRNGESMPFDCFDLSAVGLYLHSELLFDLGEIVDLHIALPNQPWPIRATGEIIRVQIDEDGMGAGMGVAFREISRQDQTYLERYLMRRFLGHA
jgi:hypothetical protein